MYMCQLSMMNTVIMYYKYVLIIFKTLKSAITYIIIYIRKWLYKENWQDIQAVLWVFKINKLVLEELLCKKLLISLTHYIQKITVDILT